MPRSPTAAAAGLHGEKWLKMLKNDQKRSKTAQNRPKMAKNRSKMAKITQKLRCSE